MTYHALSRTSPKGGPFIGTCLKCGVPNLPMSATRLECENVRGISDGAVLIELLEQEPSK